MKIKVTIAFLGFTFLVFGQQIVKVKDINPSGESIPMFFTKFNNQIVFSAENVTSEKELCITGGTESTTQLLKDINPNGGSNPTFFTVFGNQIIFVADDGTHGRELWVTDGTTAGTNLLADINSSGGSFPNNFTEFNGQLFFAADDGVNGPELWVTDGTTSGTTLLKDINPNGPGGPAGFQEYNGELYFRAGDNAHAYEIWKTDGTSAGTVLFQEINPNGHGVVYPSFIPHNNELFFVGSNGNQGFELWKTDGSSTGTVMVKDINPVGSSIPTNFFSYGSKLLFTAEDGVNGHEVWVTDGTNTGTQLLKDIAPGSASSMTNGFTAYNNKVYFKADNNDQGQANKELWETDGTTAGTQLNHDFNTAIDGGHPRTLYVFDNRLFMVANDPTWGEQIFIKDGNNAPQVVPPPLTSNYGGVTYTDQFIPLNGELIFRADYKLSEGMELWKYTGVASLEEEENKNGLHVFPNPFQNEMTIQNVRPGARVELFSINGQLLRTLNPINGQLELSDLNSGVYILKVLENKNVRSIKVVKK